MKHRKTVGVVERPKGVHRVVSRSREYFYWQPGRGTKPAAKPKPLPSDPASPGYRNAIRDVQGKAGAHIVTIGEVIDRYLTSPHFLNLGDGTKEQYKRALRIFRAGFGEQAADMVRTNMIREVMDGPADRPGVANNFLGAVRAVSSWGGVHGPPKSRDAYFPASTTEGVKGYKKTGGDKPWTDKPWTDKQLAAAEKHLTGMVRRGFFHARYTGQRGSDVVRLGETSIDEGGFRLEQQKTGRGIWCPIDDSPADEMSRWQGAPGPYLRHANSKPYARKVLDVHFKLQRDDVPELEGVTLHGLRSTRVIELRRAGLTTTQIQDQRVEISSRRRMAPRQRLQRRARTVIEFTVEAAIERGEIIDAGFGADRFDRDTVGVTATRQRHHLGRDSFGHIEF